MYTYVYDKHISTYICYRNVCEYTLFVAYKMVESRSTCSYYLHTWLKGSQKYTKQANLKRYSMNTNGDSCTHLSICFFVISFLIIFRS